VSYDALLAQIRRVQHALATLGVGEGDRVKRPRQVVATDVLPRTATGKVQRYRLRHRLST
jgi:acyl-coenzyme A synthetase/AMP-(fatty) acid ligase